MTVKEVEGQKDGIWYTKDRVNEVFNNLMQRTKDESVEYQKALLKNNTDWISDTLETLECSGVVSDNKYKQGVMTGITNMLLFMEGSVPREEVFSDLMPDIDIAGEIMYREYKEDHYDIERQANG